MNQTQKEAMRLYESGLSTTRIAAHLGITRQGVSIALIRAGVRPLDAKRARADVRRRKLAQYCSEHPTTPVSVAVAALGISRPQNFKRGDHASWARKREREARGMGLCHRCGEVPLSDMEASNTNRCKACAVIAQQALAADGRKGTRSPHLTRVLDLYRAGGMSQREIGVACGISQPQVSAILISARKRGEIA